MDVKAMHDEALAAHQDGRLDRAEALYRAVVAQADHLPSLHNLGVLLTAAGRYEEASEFYRRAVEAAPGRRDPLNAWGRHLKLGRRYAEAEAVFRQVLAARPDDDGASYDLGVTLLAQGRTGEGWPLLDRRPLRQRMLSESLGCPEWRGEPLAGKRLLVLSEEGFGDQIMMARFLPRLAASATTYFGPKPLHRLFAHLPVDYQDRAPGDQALAPHDYWTLPLSLPRWLPLDAAGAPYLQGRGQDAAGRRSGRIGVVWRGRAANRNDAFRSLAPGQAERLLALPGAMSLDPADTGAADFQATADIIAGLDLVISVDTAVAHLTGAMGRPVWVLLARHALDWQWSLASRRGWYPTARLLAQPQPGDWAGLLDRVIAAVSQL